MMEQLNDDIQSYEKRFQIPQDPEMRERLKGVHHALRDLKREYPAVLSFSMYGSMVKDTATHDSDIDGTLFIDLTPSGDVEYDSQVSTAVQSGEYLTRFKDELQSRLNLTPEQVDKDVKQETISEEEVSLAAEKYMYELALFEEEKKLWVGTRRDTGKTEVGIFGEVPVYEYDGEEPQRPSLSNNIQAMFNLDVGGGISKYRKHFLKTLEHLSPGQADVVCRAIAAYLSFTEGGKRKEMVKLPVTFLDFKDKYL